MVNEKRLIELDALIDNIDWDNDLQKWTLRGEPEDIPTVDAVEVVRCRDCVHYDLGVCLKIYSDGAVSQYAWQARNEDDFCSYGERKDNESKRTD